MKYCQASPISCLSNTKRSKSPQTIGNDEWRISYDDF